MFYDKFDWDVSNIEILPSKESEEEEMNKVYIVTIDEEFEKSRVKPFIRTRKGKLERVSEYERTGQKKEIAGKGGDWVKDAKESGWWNDPEQLKGYLKDMEYDWKTAQHPLYPAPYSGELKADIEIVRNRLGVLEKEVAKKGIPERKTITETDVRHAEKYGIKVTGPK